MFDLYTASTPNGWKASVMLEEIGADYEVHPINLMAGDQKDPDYLKLNPNGRIPTIVDRDEDNFAVFESGAILIYLAEKSGQFLPSDRRGRSEVIQWVMFQMGGIGPMMGQANVFFRYFPEKLQPAIDRYQNECRRLFEVVENRLDGREFICDDYSIADMALWCWMRTHAWSGIDMDGLTHVPAWLDKIAERPGVQRGVAVPGKLDTTLIEEAGKKITVK